MVSILSVYTFPTATAALECMQDGSAGCPNCLVIHMSPLSFDPVSRFTEGPAKGLQPVHGLGSSISQHCRSSLSKTEDVSSLLQLDLKSHWCCRGGVACAGGGDEHHLCVRGPVCLCGGH